MKYEVLGHEVVSQNHKLNDDGSQTVTLAVREKKSTGKLKISMKPGRENLKRILSHDLDVTLDGKQLPPFYKLNLEIVAQGVVRAEIGIYPSEVDVDADVLAAFGVLTKEVPSE